MAYYLISSFAVPVLAAPTNPVLFRTSNDAQKAFLWLSIGLAVLTALFQGLVTALTYMAESSNYWTFRFRLAKIEHWWWTLVSSLLMTSLVLVTLSFLSGNSSDSVSILAISTTTFLAIVRYMIPAWLSRHYIHNRWLSWTGSSRTTISKEKSAFCGNADDWRALAQQVNLSDVKYTPSDWYGPRLWPVSGLPHDPTDLLRNANSKDSKLLARDSEARLRFLYHDGDTNSRTVSLLWGTEQGFRKRASRATSSMPEGLLRSRPFTTDGYAGEGLCLAMGILGRNKGLNPKALVFKMSRDISTALENNSTWKPRPNKVLRSYYLDTMKKQYHYLGQEFVDAAVELALLLMDVPHLATSAWLAAGMEHQSINCNRLIAEYSKNNAELQANYESSYVSMIMSLNNMSKKMERRSGDKGDINRPDILCTGLLLKARGQPEPIWWNSTELADARQIEIACLAGDQDWKEPIAKLLGLAEWPVGFENFVSVWGDGCAPEKDVKGSDLGTSLKSASPSSTQDQEKSPNPDDLAITNNIDTKPEESHLPRLDSGTTTLAEEGGH